MANRWLCLLIACLLSVSHVSLLNAQVEVCEKARSHNAQNECLEREAARAEAELNTAFQHALSLYKPDAKTLKEALALPKLDRQMELEHNRSMLKILRESQRAWLVYRANACESVYRSADDGNIGAALAPICKIELTEQRTKFLKEHFPE